MTDTLWPSLRKVALISPSGNTPHDAFEQCIQRLSALGVEVITSPNLNKRHRYLAGTVKERLDDLYWAFEQPDIDAVWSLRGGYGAAQLVDHIEWSRLERAQTVPLIGYSDVTALLVAFAARGLRAIHGSSATELNRLALDASDVVSSTRWQSLASIDRAVHRRAGELTVTDGPQTAIEGRLSGGNLTVLASLCGTPAALALQGPTILLLEDIKEAFYALERSFHQLLQSLNANNIRAICLGEFSDCKGPRDAPEFAPIIREWVTPLGIAVCTGVPMGHAGNNQAFELGAAARLSSTSLTWHSTR